MIIEKCAICECDVKSKQVGMIYDVGRLPRNMEAFPPSISPNNSLVIPADFEKRFPSPRPGCECDACASLRSKRAVALIRIVRGKEI